MIVKIKLICFMTPPGPKPALRARRHLIEQVLCAVQGEETVPEVEVRSCMGLGRIEGYSLTLFS